MSRIIRINPITGEELHYYKGTANEDKEANHRRYSRNNDVTTQNKIENTNSDIMSNQANFGSSSSVTNSEKPSSTVRNENLIPLLNFNKLAIDEESNSNGVQMYKSKINDIQNKLHSLRNNDPIISPHIKEKSCRPQSSYRKGFQDLQPLDSPILAYQDLRLKQRNNNSDLPAPRNDFHKNISDLELIGSLQNSLVEKKRTLYTIERVADLERLWISNGVLTERSNERAENQEKTNNLKENMVVNTILTDQLNDPFKQSNHQQLTKTVYTARGNKFNLIDSRNNSSSLMPSALTENMLSKRCKFNCRVVSTDGKQALRELFGILFLCDNSLTIYEFRLLCGAYFTQMSGGSGQKANALPFIQRQSHKHAFGRKKGQDIDIWDIYKGSLLYIDIGEANPVIIEITEVNEQEKENLLTSAELQNKNLSPPEINQNIMFIKDRLKKPLAEIQLNDSQILNNVQKFIGDQIADRAVEVYMNLTSELKKRGQYTQGLVTTQDLYDAFLAFNIEIHSEDLNIVWQTLDLDSMGLIHYYRIMQAYCSCMNIPRHKSFRALIQKLDTLKTGYVQISDIYKYYKADRHPRVRSGDFTQNEMFEKFLSSFQLINPMQHEDFYRLSTSTDTKSQLISYEQLEQYYNGVSITVKSDAHFCSILKNSWNCF